MDIPVKCLFDYLSNKNKNSDFVKDDLPRA
jgi:hypothetical protein